MVVTGHELHAAVEFCFDVGLEFDQLHKICPAFEVFYGYLKDFLEFADDLSLFFYLPFKGQQGVFTKTEDGGPGASLRAELAVDMPGGTDGGG